MILKALKLGLGTAAVSLVVASCTVTQSYKSPEVSTDSLFRNLNTLDTNTIATIPWQQIFTDNDLQTLINKGIQNNLDLKIGMERLQQSYAYLIQSSMNFLPTLNGNANVTTSKYSDAQNPLQNTGTLYQLGLSSSWELDIWGKFKSIKNANLALVLQSEASIRAIQTSLVASIANYYYLLLALDQQLYITEQTVENWKQTVETMRALKEAGRLTEAGVVQSEAQKFAAEITIPDLKQKIKEVENALSILLGDGPGEIVRGKLANQRITNVLNTGIPAQLLSYRPDVMQAEYNYRYLFEMTNVSRTYFYPSLNITGSLGLTSLSIDKLFSSGAFGASIGGGLLQPIFNRGQNETRLKVSESQQREALHQFKKTLLNAGKEVSDALTMYESALEKNKIRDLQLDALSKSVQYSQELLQNGFANYTEIITARQSLLGAELGQVNDRLQQLQAVVYLYQALGGGWK